MTKISDLHRRWRKDADYEEAYDAIGEEFDLARALIEARTAAGLSQSQLARRMKTSQSYIARIEGGKVRPPPKRWSASRRRPARGFGSSSNRSRHGELPSNELACPKIGRSVEKRGEGRSAPLAKQFRGADPAAPAAEAGTWSFGAAVVLPSSEAFRSQFLLSCAVGEDDGIVVRGSA